jgi:hypothetical protein
VALTDTVGGDLTPWHPVTHFQLLGSDLDPALPGVMRLSPVYVDAHWDRAPTGNGNDASPTSQSVASDSNGLGTKANLPIDRI